MHYVDEIPLIQLFKSFKSKPIEMVTLSHGPLYKLSTGKLTLHFMAISLLCKNLGQVSHTHVQCSPA